MLSLFTSIVSYPPLFFWCNSFNFESKVEYLAWILSSGHVWSIIYEKKLNFGLIVLNTDLKVGAWGVDRQREDVRETLGNL